jgi:hypothetical protein
VGAMEFSKKGLTIYTKERLIEFIEKKTLFLDILREVESDLLDKMLLIEAQRFINKKQEIYLMAIDVSFAPAAIKVVQFSFHSDLWT